MPDKVQRTLASGNSGAAWNGIKAMASVAFKTGKKTDVSLDSKEHLNLVDDLNEYFTCFEIRGNTNKNQCLCWETECHYE